MSFLHSAIFLLLLWTVPGNDASELDRLRKLEILVEKQSLKLEKYSVMIDTLNHIVSSQNERIKKLESSEAGTVLPGELRQWKSQVGTILEDPVTAKTNASNTDEVDNVTKKKRLLLQPGVAPTNVGFYAYLSKSEQPGKHHTIVFDHVVTNIGNAYNKHAGDFIAPSAGVYVFSYTIYCGFRSDIYVELVVNSIQMCMSRADSIRYDFDESTSATVVLVLDAGDTCFIRTHPSSPTTGSLLSENYERSTFSGWKISA